MTFDPNDPEVQALMAGKAEAQGQAVGVGRNPWSKPSLAVAVAARRAADPTSVLDDEAEAHEDLRRAAEPALGPRNAIHASGGIVVMTPLPPQHGGAPMRQALPMFTLSRGGIQFATVVEPLTDALKPVAEAFVKLGQSITVTLENIDVAAIALALDVPADMLTGKPDEDKLARRRHGHAAVCPRHGPTKGGLCRKCQR